MNKLKKKKLISMLTYSAADMLDGGVNLILSLYYLSFLTFVMGLPPLLAGLVTGLGKIWDGLSDPIMGVIVDRTKSKVGSCRLYILLSVIPVFISYFLLWNGWGITSQAGKFFYFIFAYMFFSTCYTMAVVPYEALLPRMVDSYKERTDYSSMRMVFSGIACVASTYIYEALIPITTENPLSPLFQPNFTVLGVVLGLFFSLPLLITFFGTKEKYENKETEKLNLKKIFREYKEVFSNSTYKKFYLLTLIGAFVSYAILSSLVMFVYVVYGNIETAVMGLTLVFIIVNMKGAFEIGMFPVNVFTMKKFNKHRPYLIDIPLIIISLIIIAFVTPKTPVWVFITAVCFLGAGSSCLNFVPMTLLPDQSDIDELIYGKRREGVNAGMVTMGKQIVHGVTLTLFGVILGAFGMDTDNVSNLSVNNNSLIAIKIMFCAIPIVFCIIMFFISKIYLLDEKNHTIIKNLLNRKKNSGNQIITGEEKEICELVTGKNIEHMWINK